MTSKYLNYTACFAVSIPAIAAVHCRANLDESAG